jgi:glucosamine--fructose-6-phosphate aminotransferase (isomerizing)
MIMNTGSHTRHEIISQPQTWQLTLEAFSNRKKTLVSFLDHTAFNQILVVGCGSTHYLAQTAAALISQYTKFPARAAPSSELWMFPNMATPVGTMLVAISRSGTTTETLWALERFRQKTKGPVIVITCDPDSPLAKGADFVLASPDAREQSVAQTRSFTSMLLLAQCLAATLARDVGKVEQLNRLPHLLEAMVERSGELPRQVGEALDIERIFFLGGGPLYGLANEAMLKTKEISLTNSEAYHPMEFRHGPMSMVDEQTLVVELISDTGRVEEVRVLQDMQRLGAHTLSLVEDAEAFSDWQPDYVMQLDSGLDEWGRGPLYLPLLQRIAYHRARAKGLDPDCPNNLTAVVELQDNRPS